MNSVGLFDFLEVSIWSKTNKKYKEVKYRTSQKSIDMSYDKQTQNLYEKYDKESRERGIVYIFVAVVVLKRFDTNFGSENNRFSRKLKYKNLLF